MILTVGPNKLPTGLIINSLHFPVCMFGICYNILQLTDSGLFDIFFLKG